MVHSEASFAQWPDRTLRLPSADELVHLLTTCGRDSVTVIRFARGRAMPTYKFHIGQTVFIVPAPNLNIPGGHISSLKKLPEHNGEFEYRVRGAAEPYERIVRESELKDAP